MNWEARVSFVVIFCSNGVEMAGGNLIKLDWLVCELGFEHLFF